MIYTAVRRITKMNEQATTQRQKKKLIPDIITPNRITYVRILLIPVFVLFFYLSSVPYHYIIAAGIFALAALTDAADGHIARKYHLVTNMGKFLDPIADKVLVSTAMILLMALPDLFNAVFSYGYLLAVICVCIIMARELIISGFRQVAAAMGLVLAAEKLGKYKTTFQDIALVVLLVAASLSADGSEAWRITAIVGFALFLVATVLTVVSGTSYIVKNKAVLKS